MSLLDELPEAFNGIVPLLRRPLEVLPCLEQGVGSNDEPTFSSDTFARYDLRLFQNSQVLAHTLPTEASAVGELHDRLGAAIA